MCKEFFYGGLADETGGAGHEDAHGWLLGAPGGSVQVTLCRVSGLRLWKNMKFVGYST